MKLTASEKEWVVRERSRIALDTHDWSKEPIITPRQLLEMSPHMRRRFLLEDEIWQHDIFANVLRNTRHSANEDWVTLEGHYEAIRGKP